MKIDDGTKKIIIWGVGLTLAYFLLKNPIDAVLQKLGIKKDPLLDKTKTTTDNGLDPNYWKKYTNNGSSLISDDDLSKYVDLIYNSNQWFNIHYDISQVLSAFKSLSTKAQASYLCYGFLNEHGEELLSWMSSSPPLAIFTNRFTDDDIVTLINYVNNLPNN